MVREGKAGGAADDRKMMKATRPASLFPDPCLLEIGAGHDRVLLKQLENRPAAPVAGLEGM
jgi:hypothetical protein